MALTAMDVKQAKGSEKPEKKTDGGGLYLYVQPNGSKYWRLDYRFEGKRKTLAIGVYPDVSLADARAARDAAKKLLTTGEDPSSSQTKKAKKQIRLIESENSFQALSREFHELKSPMWSAGHAKQWLVNMERYAYPVLGELLISEIEPMPILKVLKVLEGEGKFETRDRLGQSIGAVFKYAIATGRTRFNPAAEIRTALAARPRELNFACINPDELPTFLNAITQYESKERTSVVAMAALRLLMLTATRTSEVRFARWEDFDLAKALWVIPEDQQGRKGKQGRRKAHTVPLSKQALRILKNLQAITGNGDQVFPNRNDPTRVISENTVLKIIEGIGYKGRMTGHGFRSLARSILGEMGHRREVLEAMLSHSIENPTEAAYVRTTYLKERQSIMQIWADHLVDEEGKYGQSKHVVTTLPGHHDSNPKKKVA